MTSANIEELVQEVDNGRVFISLRDGKKHGITKFVTNEDVVLSEIPYEDDEMHGQLRQYYPSGRIQVTITYRNGKQTGEFASFLENGMMQVRSNYVDGKLHGKFTVYNEFGDISSECVYDDGQRHGKYVTYYPKVQGGGICELSFYEQGLLDGDRVTFYNSGEVMSVTPYKRGRPQAYTATYTKTGEIIKQ
jgi:antitoxin component YwqK of YwqJK toxin-antitoxin module